MDGKSFYCAVCGQPNAMHHPACPRKDTRAPPAAPAQAVETAGVREALAELVSELNQFASFPKALRPALLKALAALQSPAASPASKEDGAQLGSGAGAQSDSGADSGHFARAVQSEGSTGEAPDWHPIETAPKDGTNVLLTNGVDVAQGWWVDEPPTVTEHRDKDGRYIDQTEYDGFTGWLDCDGGMQPDPTRWMPLPPAPAALATVEGKEKTR